MNTIHVKNIPLLNNFLNIENFYRILKFESIEISKVASSKVLVVQRFQIIASSLAIFLSKKDKGEHDSREKYSSIK